MVSQPSPAQATVGTTALTGRVDMAYDKPSWIHRPGRLVNPLVHAVKGFMTQVRAVYSPTSAKSFSNRRFQVWSRSAR